MEPPSSMAKQFSWPLPRTGEYQMFKPVFRIWMGRAFIAAVLAMNLQSAAAFLVNPGRYAPAYELVGIPGETAVRGFGILFLMWNIPYIFACLHPRIHRVSLYEAILMQTIGFVAESLVCKALPSGYPTLGQSILKFIVFDGIGLAALLAALIITRNTKNGA